MDFDDFSLELLPYLREGHCCSQLLMDLALDLCKEKGRGYYINAASDMLASLRGLCIGLGGAGCECGLLSGGAVVLAWLSKNNEESYLPDAMVNEYAAWFKERTAGCGCRCDEITSFLARQHGGGKAAEGRDMTACAPLLRDCWQKIIQLCESYGIDLEEEED